MLTPQYSILQSTVGDSTIPEMDRTRSSDRLRLVLGAAFVLLGIAIGLSGFASFFLRVTDGSMICSVQVCQDRPSPFVSEAIEVTLGMISLAVGLLLIALARPHGPSAVRPGPT